jgi:hypothetical protein
MPIANSNHDLIFEFMIRAAIDKQSAFGNWQSAIANDFPGATDEP